jgi:EAL and modified HD-GYP domain-containing signal transduction protein
MVLSDSAQATEEQLTSIMTRARLCQIVATSTDLSGDAAFTVGLLSGISDRLGVPLIELLARLPLEPSVMDALVRGQGRFGVVLHAVRAYEAGNLTAGDDALSGRLDLTAAYLSAVDWAVRTCESALVSAN